MKKLLCSVGGTIASLLMMLTLPSMTAEAAPLAVGETFHAKASIYEFNFKVNSAGKVTITSFYTKPVDDDGFISSGSAMANFTVPNTVTYGDYTYTITEIGDRAFQGSTISGTVVLNKDLKKIGSQIFSSSSSFTTLEFSGHPDYLAKDAFSNCDNIERVICLFAIYSGTAKPTTTNSSDSDENVFGCYKTAKCYVPDAVLEGYKKAKIWKNFEDLRPISELVESFDLKEHEVDMLKAQNHNIDYSVTPSKYKGYGDIWTYDNAAVVSMKPTYIGNVNLVEAVGDGTATVSVKCGQFTDQCKINVSSPDDAIATLILPNAGKIILPIKPWGKSFKFTVIPPEGWTINSFRVNGKDESGQVKINSGKTTDGVSYEIGDYVLNPNATRPDNNEIRVAFDYNPNADGTVSIIYPHVYTIGKKLYLNYGFEEGDKRIILTNLDGKPLVDSEFIPIVKENGLESIEVFDYGTYYLYVDAKYDYEKKVFTNEGQKYWIVFTED